MIFNNDTIMKIMFDRFSLIDKMITENLTAHELHIYEGIINLELEQYKIKFVCGILSVAFVYMDESIIYVWDEETKRNISIYNILN